MNTSVCCHFSSATWKGGNINIPQCTVWRWRWHPGTPACAPALSSHRPGGRRARRRRSRSSDCCLRHPPQRPGLGPAECRTSLRRRLQCCSQRYTCNKTHVSTMLFIHCSMQPLNLTHDTWLSCGTFHCKKKNGKQTQYPVTMLSLEVSLYVVSGCTLTDVVEMFSGARPLIWKQQHMCVGLSRGRDRGCTR